MMLIQERNRGLAERVLHHQSDVMFAGVVAGHNPGMVWANSLECPRALIVWSGGLEGICLMGDAQELPKSFNLKQFLEQELHPFIKELGINYVELSIDHHSWESVIEETLGAEELKSCWQYIYSIEHKHIEHKSFSNIEGYRIVELDEKFFSDLPQGNFKNSRFLEEYTMQYWGSVANFLNTGYGYIALSEDNEIVSLAVSSAYYNNTHAIGVETLTEHRQKGLSSSLVERLLEKYKQHGYNVWWDCTETNIASQKTVERVGLPRGAQYRVYWYNF